MAGPALGQPRPELIPQERERRDLMIVTPVGVLAVDDARRRCCVGESRTDIAVEALASDGQREFAEDRFEPVTGHGVESEFVVAAAKVLHKRVPAADRLRAA
jgi:hypothetical protein